MMDSIVNPSHNHAGVFGWAISFLKLDDFIILMCGAQLNQLKPAISFSFPKWNAVDSISISRSNYLSAFRTWKSRIC
jgi:hypothetical protein